MRILLIGWLVAAACSGGGPRLLDSRNDATNPSMLVRPDQVLVAYTYQTNVNVQGAQGLMVTQSTDGVSWQPSVSVDPSAVSTVDFNCGPLVPMFDGGAKGIVIGYQTSAGAVIARSQDGVTWTLHPTPLNYTWSPGFAMSGATVWLFYEGAGNVAM